MMPFGRGPTGSTRHLNKHSSMNSLSKSGSGFVVNGDLNMLGRNKCFNLFHIHLVKVGIGRCSDGYF